MGFACFLFLLLVTLSPATGGRSVSVHSASRFFALLRMTINDLPVLYLSFWIRL